MTTTAAPSPELFFDTLQGYQRTAAIRAAIELGLFTAIVKGAHSAEQIAATCKASTRGTRILCDYLTLRGFLTKNGKTYEATPDTALFLNQDSPAYLGGLIDFLNAPAITRHFDGLTETVRKGTVAGHESTVADENPVWETFARAMVPMMMPSALEMAEILSVGPTGPMRVLDIAAGHGVFGIALAQKNSQAEIVAVDWKGVLKVATENATKMGVGARHRTLPGDAFKVDFGSGFDLALMTNFLHHYDVPTCTALLAKVAGSLKQGGRIAVLEFVPNDDRVSPPMPAAFSLQMLAGTPSGDAYTLRELTGMLQAAGFGDVSAHPLQGPETLVVARK